MKKFMALYMARASAIEQMMKATPEQMKAGMDEWMKWAKSNEKEIVELGTPLGKTKRITSAGISDTKNEITGYLIVQGDSVESVAKIFEGHPHLQMEGTFNRSARLLGNSRDVKTASRGTAISPRSLGQIQRYAARMRLLRGLSSTSARPRTRITGGT